MRLTREQKTLARLRAKAERGPLTLDERSLKGGLELADAAALSIMERRPHLTRERAEVVRDRLASLRITARNRRR